jgi:magnesium transporter
MARTQLVVEPRGRGLETGHPPEQISDLLRGHGNLLWLDITDPGGPEIALLRREFGFHELALEDVVTAHQRPKCDTYPKYYFLVVYAAAHTQNRFVPVELQMFWGENYLVTIHRGSVAVLEEARKRWQAHDQRRQHGIAYLVYAIFDSLVDDYMRLQDWVEERVGAIEDAVFEHADTAVLAELFRLRKDLLRMRRLLGPTRDVLNEIIRRDLPLFPVSLGPYFADVYDHVLRVLDGLDLYRELLTSALDIHMSTVSNRLNRLVKRMTALTLVVMVPTLIAGIYGMNFHDPWPAYETPWGFGFALALMAALVVGGLYAAYRADWL